MIDKTKYQDMNIKKLNNELLKACERGKLEIVKYLLTNSELEKHPDIYYKDEYCWNTLRYACFYNQMAVTQYLLIDLNMEVDNDTLEWLEGKNKYKKIFHDVLRLINVRDLHQKLDNNISDDKINNKRLKL